MKHLILILFLSVPLSIMAQSTTQESMMHDGENRSYYLHLPPQYDGSTKLPVVFVLHGLGDSADNMLNTGFTTLGNQEGFISVYPQGLQSTLGTAWNNGSNITLLGFTPDDIGFISNLVDLLVNDYAADDSRIYSCGFSMGGIMSHYLGCNLSDKITAIASMAGTMANSVNCSPNRAVPALHIHGDADATVSYDGDALYGLRSAAETVQVWAEVNGCAETPEDSMLPDSADDGLTITKTDYAPCSDDTEAILYTVHGAGHIWLGPSNDIFTTLEFWNFFKEHSMSSTTPVNDVETISFSIHPNPVVDVLNISGLEKEMQITISDITGKEYIRVLSSDQVDVTALAKGTYFIQIMDMESGDSQSEKLVKL